MYEKKDETTKLERFLDHYDQGAVLSPQELSQAIGLDFDGSDSRGYKLLNRVAKKIERQTDGHKCWRWVRSERCYRCLSNSEMPVDVDLRVKSMRRSSRRNILIASAVDVDRLSDSQRNRLLANLAINSCVESITSRADLSKMERRIASVMNTDTEGLKDILHRRATISVIAN